jgi:uncharacterized protein YxjI
MKNLLFILSLLITQLSSAQTIRIKDEYGEKAYYVDGNFLRNKDQYGEKLFYYDGGTIRRTDEYGEKLLFIDGSYVRYKNAIGEKVFYLMERLFVLKMRMATNYITSTAPPFVVVTNMEVRSFTSKVFLKNG